MTPKYNVGDILLSTANDKRYYMLVVEIKRYEGMKGHPHYKYLYLNTDERNHYSEIPIKYLDSKAFIQKVA